MYLPLCVCRDVLFTFGVWVFCFYGHWLFDLLVGVFLFVCFVSLLCEGFFVGGFFFFSFFVVLFLVWFGFEHAIST